jgi:hypothetical protein
MKSSAGSLRLRISNLASRPSSSIQGRQEKHKLRIDYCKPPSSACQAILKELSAFSLSFNHNNHPLLIKSSFTVQLLGNVLILTADELSHASRPLKQPFSLASSPLQTQREKRLVPESFTPLATDLPCKSGSFVHYRRRSKNGRAPINHTPCPPIGYTPVKTFYML